MSRIVLQGAKLDVIVLHVLSNDSKEFSMPKSVACKSSEWCCTLSIDDPGIICGLVLL